MIKADPDSRESVVSIRGVTKKFNNQTILDNLDLTIKSGEFLTLLGPSGCGKSTTLNVVAGFITPDGGDVYLRGRHANHLAPRYRDLGMVFQSWALFPHMTVFDNVAYGLRARKVDASSIAKKVSRMLDMVRLGAAEHKYPSQLSGGMQQRVALARALVNDPDVLLLDEPLSNLDANLRKEMQVEIKRIHSELNVTTLLVTHSQEEALVMSDNVAVMRGGKIEQLASPMELYRNPKNSFVCKFLGEANFFVGKIEGVDPKEIKISVGGLPMTAARNADDSTVIGKTMKIGLRPEWISLHSSADTADKSENTFVGTVTSTTFLGDRVNYEIKVGDVDLSASLSPRFTGEIFKPNDPIVVSFPSRCLQVLEEVQ